MFLSTNEHSFFSLDVCFRRWCWTSKVRCTCPHMTIFEPRKLKNDERFNFVQRHLEPWKGKKKKAVYTTRILWSMLPLTFKKPLLPVSMTSLRIYTENSNKFDTASFNFNTILSSLEYSPWVKLSNVQQSSCVLMLLRWYSYRKFLDDLLWVKSIL